MNINETNIHTHIHINRNPLIIKNIKGNSVQNIRNIKKKITKERYEQKSDHSYQHLLL